MNLNWVSRATTATAKAYYQLERSVTDPVTSKIFYWNPLALSAKANQEDYPMLHEIQHINDKEQDLWNKSIDNEMQGLYRKECFKLVNRMTVE